LSERAVDRRPVGRVLWILGTLVLGIAVFLGRQQIIILSSWTKVDGEVTTSEIVRHFVPKSKPIYRLRVTFQYPVNNVAQFAVSSSSLGSTDMAPVSRKAALFPVGSHHPIRYDPANPTEMRWDAGYNVEFLAVPLIVAGAGVLFIAAGVAFWLAERR
jgi:hypothetical protein